MMCFPSLRLTMLLPHPSFPALLIPVLIPAVAPCTFLPQCLSSHGSLPLEPLLTMLFLQSTPLLPTYSQMYPLRLTLNPSSSMELSRLKIEMPSFVLPSLPAVSVQFILFYRNVLLVFIPLDKSPLVLLIFSSKPLAKFLIYSSGKIFGIFEIAPSAGNN